MIFKSGFKIYCLSLFLIVVFVVSCKFGLKAEDLDTEVQAGSDKTAGQAIVSDEEGLLQEKPQAKEMGLREERVSETVVFGGETCKKQVRFRKARLKGAPSLDMESGMVEVEGEEIISDVSAVKEAPQHTGIGQSLHISVFSSSMISTGDSGGGSASGMMDITSISLDSAQQQGGIDMSSAQALMNWFLANLKGPSLSKDATLFDGFDKHYQVSRLPLD